VYVTWKINRYGRITDSSWETSPTEITSFHDPVVRTSIGEGRDTFAFRQTNVDDTLDSYWNIGDKVILADGVRVISRSLSLVK